MKKIVRLLASITLLFCLSSVISACKFLNRPVHSHFLTHVSASQETCTTKGNIEYWFCSGCNKKFLDANAITEVTNVVISAAHTGGTEIRNDKDPTEDEEGYTGDTYCLGCGQKIGIGTTIEKLEHVHIMTKTERREATCTSDGNVEYYTCSKCNNLYLDINGLQETSLANTVIVASHKLVHHSSTSATCTVNGNIEYWSCSTCNKNYSDADATTEVTNVIIPAEHTLTYYAASSATCTKDGNIEYWSCSGCNKKFSDANATTEVNDVVLPAAHTGGTEIRNNKAPTEYEEGYTGDTYCLGCGQILSSGVVLPPISNQPVIIVSDAIMGKDEDIVNVTIFIKNNPGIASLKFALLYSDVLSIKSVEFADEFGVYVTAPEPYINPQTFNWISTEDNELRNGLFVSITFTLTSEVTESTTADIHIILDDANIFDAELNLVQFDSIDATVTINR